MKTISMFKPILLFIYIYISVLCSISAKEGSRCRIRIKDKGIDVEGVSRIYKNAKNIAANKALRALTTEN